jgi:hypothetical protein
LSILFRVRVVRDGHEGFAFVHESDLRPGCHTAWPVQDDEFNAPPLLVRNGVHRSFNGAFARDAAPSSPPAFHVDIDADGRPDSVVSATDGYHIAAVLMQHLANGWRPRILATTRMNSVGYSSTVDVTALRARDGVYLVVQQQWGRGENMVTRRVFRARASDGEIVMVLSVPGWPCHMCGDAWVFRADPNRDGVSIQTSDALPRRCERFAPGPNGLDLVFAGFERCTGSSGRSAELSLGSDWNTPDR